MCFVVELAFIILKIIIMIRLLFLFLPIFLTAQDRTADSLYLHANYSKRELMVTMRDGVKLFTSIYEPKAAGKHPVLLTRTPYSCAPYGKDFKAFYSNYLMKYIREGYIMVTQDVRGKYMSEGEYMDIRPFNPGKKGKDADEASDTYDAVDWLVKHTDNNGSVGVFGVSYPGFYSTMAALSGHPAIKAVSPQAPVTDWFIGDDFHHNGAFFLNDAFHFYSSFGQPRPMPTTEGNKAYQYKEQDNYNFFLKVGAIKHFMKPEYLGDKIAFWKDLFAHPDYDAWWEERNIRKHLKGIKPAVLTVGGSFDAEDCWGAWETYKAIERQNPASSYNKIVFGPWAHGGWSRGDGRALGNVRFGSATSTFYQDSIEFPFFQKMLNNQTSLPDLPEAFVFFTGEDKWHKLPQWPPVEVTAKPVYLHQNGKLSFEKPTATKSTTTYTSDPAKPVPYTEDVHLRRTREYMTDDQRFAARRPDVLVFETEALAEDLTLAGELVAELVASISTTDADFVVKIIDVFPDDFKYPDAYGESKGVPMQGYQMLVRGEVMRGRYRDSFGKPSPFKPKEPTNVRLVLPDVAHTFKKGHKLMVQIQSSWFPLVDRNPQQFVNIYKCDDKDFVKADISIWHDANRASKVLLPVMVGGKGN